MWIFLNNAMLSVVEDRGNEENLLVRARIEGDISRVFPEAQVAHTPEFDYAYRSFIPRATVAQALAEAVSCIDYPNFKGSIPASDLPRHHAYMDVWVDMHDFQSREARRARSMDLCGNG